MTATGNRSVRWQPATGPDMLRIEPLGELAAAYDRGSGRTRMVSFLAAALLALPREPVRRDALPARLAPLLDLDPADIDTETLDLTLADLERHDLFLREHDGPDGGR